MSGRAVELLGCRRGRDVFRLLTVRENLETGFAVLPRRERKVPEEIFDLFPDFEDHAGTARWRSSGGQQQQLSIARALVMEAPADRAG